MAQAYAAVTQHPYANTTHLYHFKNLFFFACITLVIGCDVTHKPGAKCRYPGYVYRNHHCSKRERWATDYSKTSFNMEY